MIYRRSKAPNGRKWHRVHVLVKNVAKAHVRSIALTVGICILSLHPTYSYSYSTEEKIIGKDGREIIRIVAGKEPRTRPFQTIAICSEEIRRDIGVLKRIVDIIAPDEE